LFATRGDRCSLCRSSFGLVHGRKIQLPILKKRPYLLIPGLLILGAVFYPPSHTIAQRGYDFAATHPGRSRPENVYGQSMHQTGQSLRERIQLAGPMVQAVSPNRSCNAPNERILARLGSVDTSEAHSKLGQLLATIRLPRSRTRELQHDRGRAASDAASALSLAETTGRPL